MKSMELFAGAGGLALGTAFAGFKHVGVFEWNRDACNTMHTNQVRGIHPTTEWPEVLQTNVRRLDCTRYRGLDLVSGGPPCQPFSIGGRHRGHKDERNLFPEVVRAVRETEPKAVLIENVKGLLRPKFANFVQYIRLQLTYPEIIQKDDENWSEHLSRLERFQTGRSNRGLTYNVVLRKANAADYGVPQRRERVFFIGFRSDLSPEWSFPEPTHSCDALLYRQWVSGEYWEQHQIAKSKRPDVPERFRGRVQMLRSLLFGPVYEPWQTVRDAICDLPVPKPDGCKNVLNHQLNPGARIYKGHTGSPVDEPAKTLKAGDHGVPGGENMLAELDGSVRYFTVRESARLQTFPDDYLLTGSWTEAMRQLGNAVPVRLATIVAQSIYEKLRKEARS